MTRPFRASQKVFPNKFFLPRNLDELSQRMKALNEYFGVAEGLSLVRNRDTVVVQFNSLLGTE